MNLKLLHVLHEQTIRKIEKNKIEEAEIYNSPEFLICQKRIEDNKLKRKLLIADEKQYKKQIKQKENYFAKKAKKIHLAEMEKQFQSHYTVYMKNISIIHSSFSRTSELMKNLDKHFLENGILTKNEYDIQMDACKIFLEGLKTDFQQLIELMALTCDHDRNYNENYSSQNQNDSHWTKLHRFLPSTPEDQFSLDLHVYFNNYKSNEEKDVWYCICSKCKKIKEFCRDRCN